MQIRETIRSHFEKEKEFFEQGLRIKVLSLFFIYEVSKYRACDEDGNEVLGEYGKMFEEEYRSVLNEFSDLFPGYYQNYLEKTTDNISACHEGYFSRDKKGRLANTSGETDEDLTTYDLSLKKKEVLLDFDMPIRFIFSHSALREGWDNPNVFQELWKKINHKYTYTCHFNSEELIKNAVDAIKSDLKVVPMRYTLEIGKQKDKIDETEVRSGTSFGGSKTETKSLSRAVASTVKYDLVGDIAKGCKLTRKTVATILSQL